mmetsp:Transcript_13862/g.44505  ORF Transcript_13862/g.44505 Transcript_13862/m.44505 type:complete len:211 (+) Transcript_13862:779-1411(+)
MLSATSEAPLFASGPDRLPEEPSPPCLALTGSARLGRGSAADSEPLLGTARAAASPPLLRPEGSLAGFGRRSFRPSSSSFAGAGALPSAGRAGGSTSDSVGGRARDRSSTARSGDGDHAMRCAAASRQQDSRSDLRRAATGSPAKKRRHTHARRSAGARRAAPTTSWPSWRERTHVATTERTDGVRESDAIGSACTRSAVRSVSTSSSRE